MGKIIISPQTKVGELLEAYPELETVLIRLAPAFSALKNPILKRTVGRVASLSQAAVVGGIKVEDLVNKLRAEIGEKAILESGDEGQYVVTRTPGWFSVEKVIDSFDATPLINSGGSPMTEILHRAGKLNQGEILEVISPFVPAPILDMLTERKFRVFCQSTNGVICSYITPDLD
jgi:hypothetical protein